MTPAVIVRPSVVGTNSAWVDANSSVTGTQEIFAMSHVAEVSDVHRLESAVRNRLSSRLRSLRVLVLSEGLVLQGEAHTYHAKQLWLRPSEF